MKRAPPFGCNILPHTAHSSREAGLQKQDFVVITAASSSVGIASIEITKNQGAIAIAATRTRAKTAQLLAIGADHVIVTNEEDLVARVKDITGGRGARIIFDPIGGNGLTALAEAAGPSALILEYGIMADEPTPYPLFIALKKHLTIKATRSLKLSPTRISFRRSLLPPRNMCLTIFRNAA